MNLLYANLSASVTELKRNPAALIRAAGNAAVAILNHNRPSAYLVPVDVFEEMMERLDDLELAEIVRERASEKPQAIAVDLDDL